MQSLSQAMRLAAEKSKSEQCTLHINAHVRLDRSLEPVIEYLVSDWYSSDSTVYTYQPNGEGERT